MAEHQKYGLISWNSDNNIEILRQASQTWGTQFIEQEFNRLIFNMQDV
jgi:hypothetical protein